MNKTELTSVVLLAALLLGWFLIQSKLNPTAVVEEGPVAGTTAISNEVETASAHVATPAKEPAAADVSPAVSIADAGHSVEEAIAVLENQDVVVMVTSWGGAIKSVRMKNFRSTLDRESSPVELDFASAPALALEGIPGLSTNNDFTIEPDAGGFSVRIRRETREGWRLVRTLSLDPTGYQIHVTDNVGPADMEGSVSLPLHAVVLGSMRLEESHTKSSGMAYLGVDTLAETGGEKVKHWGTQIPSYFGGRGSWMSCGRQPADNLPLQVSHVVSNSVSWAAVKNKFFVQIVMPSSAAGDCEIRATRRDEQGKSLVVDSVSARLRFDEKALRGGEPFTRDIHCYIGPKLQSAIGQLDGHREDVMEFGTLKWVCKLLLKIMNSLYAHIPNYGVVIILLSLIVKGAFWPITRKSTQSMKKMQEIQPEVNELRTKYKANPQKMNQEVMALYRKHKVNPVSGCLPMLVQLPVLFALFTVLRSAVELRFAPFLWIADLSEPEGLLAGVLPIPLNLLPIAMTVMTVLQQHLMPTSADPQQKKMMTYMTLIMLFMFYTMASALVLYWTVSQSLSIIAVLYQRRRDRAGTVPKTA